MLFDPRWTRINRPSFSEPSLEGFEAFIALQMLRDPNGEYRWADACHCAVAQYLMSLGRWSYSWYDRMDSVVQELDYLACGDHPRDRRGRFADEFHAVWRWRDLYKRVQEQGREIRICLAVAA